MAWTSPRTWVAGEIPTAALFNTYLRDNQTAISGHGHTGSAGDGTRALKPQTINLVATGTPSAPGTGTMILYGSADLLHLRTSAAVTIMANGTHEHTMGFVQDTHTNGSPASVTNVGTGVTSTLSAPALTIAGTSERGVLAWYGAAFPLPANTDGYERRIAVHLYRDGTKLGESTRMFGAGVQMSGTYFLHTSNFHIQASGSATYRTAIFFTGGTPAGGSRYAFAAQFVGAAELKEQ